MNLSIRPKLTFNVYRFNHDVVIGFYILLLISGTLSLLLAAFMPGLVARLVDELFLLMLTGCVAFAILWTKRLSLSGELLWILLFSAIAIFTSVVNRVRLDVFLLGFLLIVKPLVIYFIYQTIPLQADESARLLKNLVRFFAVVTVISISYTLVVEKGLGVNFLPGDEGDVRLGMLSSRSFFVHASQFSSMMTFTIYIFLARLLVGEGNKKANLVLIFLSLIGVLLTLRLKTLFLLPVGVLLMYVLIYYRNARIKKKTILQSAVLLLAAAILLLVVSYLFLDILILRFGPDTQSVRTVLLKVAMRINRETAGFGVGVGMFGSSVSVNYHYSEWYYLFGLNKLRGATPQNPSFITDQWWSWYLGEVGIVGTAVFLIILFQIIKKLNKIARTTFDNNKGLSSFAYATLSSLLFGILAGFAGVYLSAPPTGYIIMSLAGITISLYRGNNSNQVEK